MHSADFSNTFWTSTERNLTVLISHELRRRNAVEYRVETPESAHI